MKTLKTWFNKIKLFIFHILEVVVDFMNTTAQAQAQVEIEKIKAGKEILIATGNAGKEMLIATGSTVKNAIKAPFVNKKNMRVTGVIVIGLGIGLGGSLIFASYLN